MNTKRSYRIEVLQQDVHKVRDIVARTDEARWKDMATRDGTTRVYITVEATDDARSILKDKLEGHNQMLKSFVQQSF